VDTAAAGKPAAVEVVVEGRPRPCPAEVEEQLLRIGQEAVNNALRHASPRQVRVTLDYRADALSLRVTDDGCGFVPNGRTDVPAGEHWGLVTMKERTTRIGGQFEIRSSPGSGTTVEATAPLPAAP
jgi:signal transduction histidine kinase